MATATSRRRRGELRGESLPVAAQRPSDVRRLSLVPKVTGWAAGPGTICVCPPRVCGASGVWRSCGNALLARGQAGDGTQRPFSALGDPRPRRGGVCAQSRTPRLCSCRPGFLPTRGAPGPPGFVLLMNARLGEFEVTHSCLEQPRPQSPSLAHSGSSSRPSLGTADVPLREDIVPTWSGRRGGTRHHRSRKSIRCAKRKP